MKDNNASITAVGVVNGIYLTAITDKKIAEYMDPMALEMYGFFRNALLRDPENFKSRSGIMKMAMTFLPPKMMLGLIDSYNLGMAPNYIMRKSGIEGEVRKLIAEKQIEQIAVIGAGYDTLAFRLAQICPDVSFYEQDHPATQKSKLNIITRKSFIDKFGEIPKNLNFISADLEKVALSDALDKRGVKRDKKTLFLMEGVLYYLPEPVVHGVFESVSKFTDKNIDNIFVVSMLDSLEKMGDPSAKKANKLMKKVGEPYKFAANREEFVNIANKYLYKPLAISSYSDLQQPVADDAYIQKLGKRRGEDLYVFGKGDGIDGEKQQGAVPTLLMHHIQRDLCFSGVEKAI